MSPTRLLSSRRRLSSTSQIAWASSSAYVNLVEHAYVNLVEHAYVNASIFTQGKTRNSDLRFQQ